MFLLVWNMDCNDMDCCCMTKVSQDASKPGHYHMYEKRRRFGERKNQGGVGERTKLKAKNNSPIPPHLICTCPQLSALSGAPNDNFLKNICSEDDFRPRIFGTFVVKFLACMPLLGFSNI